LGEIAVMRNIEEVLREILSDSAIVKPIAQNGDGAEVSLLLGESRIAVLDIPLNTIVVNMYAVSPGAGRVFLHEKRAWLSGSYVFAGTLHDRGFIAFVEVNDTAAQRSETEKRLRGAVCVMDYCAALAREFCGSPGLFGGLSRHFVKIKAQGRVYKRFDFNRRLAANDSIENIRVLEGDQIPFIYLIA
jgi:hypothetical protein